MRISAFITSGILEKYVLEMVTEEEKHEILEAASQHLEIKEELAAIRKTLQEYLLTHEVALPKDLKTKVMQVSDKKAPSFSKTLQDPRPVSSNYNVSSQKKQQEGGMPLASIAAALLGLALIAVSFTAYTFFNDAENAKTKIAEGEEQIVGLEKQLELEQETSEGLKTQLDFYHNRNNEIILINGTRRSPNTKAVIYWNENSKKASIDLPSMPVLGNNKVAILWVNADRNAQKIGVLKVNDPGELTPLTYVDNAGLFFVTEENGPDVERPTRSRILMTGN